MDLRDQKILVFGSLGRAGSAVARKLCQEKASVMLSARRAEDGEKFAAALSEEGFDAHFVAPCQGGDCSLFKIIGTGGGAPSGDGQYSLPGAYQRNGRSALRPFARRLGCFLTSDSFSQTGKTKRGCVTGCFSCHARS